MKQGDKKKEKWNISMISLELGSKLLEEHINFLWDRKKKVKNGKF